jgi:hypothetical protein
MRTRGSDGAEATISRTVVQLKLEAALVGYENECPSAVRLIYDLEPISVEEVELRTSVKLALVEVRTARVGAT